MRARQAIVLHIAFKGRADSDSAWRDSEARLDEAVGLTAAIGLVVVAAQVVNVARPVPATLIGSGKLDEIAQAIHELGPEVVVVNAQLSPVQQRNLERAWQTKVVDRTALILEIFGERAKTREGRLQVELAHLTYQRSRLVRSWTHLERQRGGFGFLGGPGETQIETDRRLIGERLAKIRKELESVKRTRGLHREARRRVPYPIVALVGYTNAGKSTLFNTLTKAQVVAENLLFATLDPTMRAIKLPDRRQIILSDTVGFISDLPTELVAAFRATLEEVLEADLIVHVRDASHRESEAQKADVLKVLSTLGIDPGGERLLIEALNKIDLLPAEAREGLLAQNRAASSGPIAISALNGAGLDVLLERMTAVLGQERIIFHLDLDAADGEGLAWSYAHGQILERHDTEDGPRLEIAVDPQELERFTSRFGERLKAMPITNRIASG